MSHPINVTEQHDAWQRASQRAASHGGMTLCALTEASYIPSGAFFATFDVASATAPDRRYAVDLKIYAGRIAARCDCPAGQHGNFCWHVAAAARVLGHVPPVETLKKMPDTPDTDERPAPAPDPEPDPGAELAYVFSGGYRRDLMAGKLA